MRPGEFAIAYVHIIVVALNILFFAEQDDDPEYSHSGPRYPPGLSLSPYSTMAIMRVEKYFRQCPRSQVSPESSKHR